MADDRAPAYVLTFSCVDAVGIVAAVTGLLAERDGFILDSQQYADLDSGRFFMRVEFRGEGPRFPEGLAGVQAAFAPIVAPSQCPWGEKALTGYLGDDREDWHAYDACALLDQGLRVPDLLVDQGDADNFLAEQLKTELLVEACERNGQKADIRMQPGYDHSYYFISTFMAEHVAWHAERLKA